MKKTFGIYLLSAFLIFGLSGCSLYDTFVKPFQNDPVVVDAWARGKRAEERGEYQRAKEEYYFVKRFATTLSLQKEAQRRYEVMSHLVEAAGMSN
jgi:hypothetical protein